MKELEKYITDEKTGLKYELVGDYYFLAGDDEPEERRTIGIWERRHLRYLRRCKKATYMALLEDVMRMLDMRSSRNVYEAKRRKS